MARLSADSRRGRARSTAVALIASFLIVGASAAPVLAGDPPPPLEPIDPQIVTQAADQTWDDYNPIPGSPYADPSIEPSIERFNVALILTDFPDTPFVITQPQGSTVFGNPGELAHDIPRDAVPAFYRDWLNVPSAMNEFQGMNRYWMEDTYGKYGVALEGYGPYLLPGDQNEYFINDITGSNNLTCAVQTRTTTAQAIVTDVEVVSTASFSVGKIVRGLTAGAGQSANTLNRVVTEIVDATHLRTGAASTLAAASAAAATNIKYATTAALQGLAVGDTLHIGFDDRLEIRTITAVGTAGSGGTGIDLDAPLAFAHASNTILRDMTTSAIASVPADTFVNTCNRNYRTDTLIAWTDHVSQAERDAYDNTFYVAAGQDESGTWQEFGEMVFTQDTVPDEFGPPNPEITQNWAATRYIPWTSWRSAATIWPSASGNNSVEGEGSGMAVYAHELTHNLGLPDNYNNPYAAPFQRAATGYWSMMSRGSFGGPGGTHNRWHIPSTLGTALGSQHVIRDKIALGFVGPANFVDLTRGALDDSGLAVVEITARQVDPGDTGQTGVRIILDGGDQTPACSVFTTTLAAPAAAGETAIQVASAANILAGRELTVGTPANGERHTIASVAGTTVTLGEPLARAHASGEDVSNRLNCSGTAPFSNYTLEVTDQVGSDSFQADSGVLIEKNKNNSGSCGSFSCFAWVVDAHPEDINMVDFVRPDGTAQQVTTGDPRQLTDGAFHAGTNSGSLYEWEDARNGLHFYILNRHVDEDGVLRYTVAVQNINGAGPHERGVELDPAPALSIAEQATTCLFPLTNSGEAAAIGDLHPDDNEAAYLNNDVYRLTTSAEGAGWYAQLPNALATAAFGETVSVPVYVSREQGSSTNATIELTATSVSDPTKTATATCATSVQGQTVVTETIDFLAALTSSGSQTNKRIADAIAELQKSLASTYWTSEPCTLSSNGKGLFDQHKKAVQSLLLVTSPSSLEASLLPYIQNIVQADRNLVVCAITAHAGGDPAKLALASQYLALGDSNYAAGLYKEAIDAYKVAWDEARKA